MSTDTEVRRRNWQETIRAVLPTLLIVLGGGGYIGVDSIHKADTRLMQDMIEQHLLVIRGRLEHLEDCEMKHRKLHMDGTGE